MDKQNRTEIISLIEQWHKDEILYDVYGGNIEEWADNLLFTLETEHGLIVIKEQKND